MCMGITLVFFRVLFLYCFVKLDNNKKKQKPILSYMFNDQLEYIKTKW